jgi:hypothetical protein
MSFMTYVTEIIQFLRQKHLTPTGITYIESHVQQVSGNACDPFFNPHEIIYGCVCKEFYPAFYMRMLLRSTSSKEVFHEGWTMGSTGNGFASRAWKGE